jgi:hypothetical protein
MYNLPVDLFQSLRSVSVVDGLGNVTELLMLKTGGHPWKGGRNY